MSEIKKGALEDWADDEVTIAGTRQRAWVVLGEKHHTLSWLLCTLSRTLGMKLGRHLWEWPAHQVREINSFKSNKRLLFPNIFFCVHHKTLSNILLLLHVRLFYAHSVAHLPQIQVSLCSYKKLETLLEAKYSDILAKWPPSRCCHRVKNSALC